MTNAETESGLVGAPPDFALIGDAERREAERCATVIHPLACLPDETYLLF